MKQSCCPLILCFICLERHLISSALKCKASSADDPASECRVSRAGAGRAALRQTGRIAALTLRLAAPIRCLCCATVSVPVAMRAAAFCAAGGDHRSFGGGGERERPILHTMMMPTSVNVIDTRYTPRTSEQV